MWTILITLLLVGYGAPAATPTPIPQTATPTPPSGPLPGFVAEGIEVTFDGIECTVSGPTELPIGEHSFVLKDLSGQNQVLYVSYLLDGKTFQDFLDEQPNEPDVYLPKPSWVIHTPQLGEPIKANGGKAWTYILR